MYLVSSFVISGWFNFWCREPEVVEVLRRQQDTREASSCVLHSCTRTGETDSPWTSCHCWTCPSHFEGRPWATTHPPPLCRESPWSTRWEVRSPSDAYLWTTVFVFLLKTTSRSSVDLCIFIFLNECFLFFFKLTVWAVLPCSAFQILGFQSELYVDCWCEGPQVCHCYKHTEDLPLISLIHFIKMEINKQFLSCPAAIIVLRLEKGAIY